MPHIHDLIDFTVDVFIVYQNKVLLIFHKKHKMWLAVGGHIELDEDPEEALFREVKEECGLEIEVVGEKPTITSKGTKFLYPPAFLDIHDVTENHKHIALRYIAKSKSDKFTHNKDEHDDIRWFAEEDLDNPEFNIKPDIKFYAREALKKS
jgi:ADP-ribose pyrophosphatase YjhB (NUDIX family)